MATRRSLSCSSAMAVMPNAQEEEHANARQAASLRRPREDRGGQRSRWKLQQCAAGGLIYRSQGGCVATGQQECEGIIVTTNDSNEAPLSVAESFEQALATITVSASNLPALGEGGQAIVDISKFTIMKILNKRSGPSGVEYKCELGPLWLAAG
jgi:hypothetical protein